MKNVMLDFETFGNGKNALVCQVGACYFDIKTGEIGAKFKANIDAESAQKSGGEFDASTVYWWLSQSQEARNSILAEGREDITKVFTELNEFLSNATAIWSHATFDFVILTETCKRLGVKPQFSYRVARDIRTLMDLSSYKSSEKRQGVAHDALDDCIYQVAYCVAARKKLFND